MHRVVTARDQVEDLVRAGAPRRQVLEIPARGRREHPVPEDRLTDAIDMPRQWASPKPGDVPRRRFRTNAIFDGDHDLGARAKQIDGLTITLRASRLSMAW
jgi:hypothetical protein